MREEFGADSVERLTITECVVQKPQMWTINGSLEEVISFLNGFAMAIAELDCNPQRKPYPKEAINWLVKEAGLNDPMASNKYIVIALRKKYETDENILEKLTAYLKTKRS